MLSILKNSWKFLITFIQAIGLVVLFGKKEASIMLGLYRIYLDDISELNDELNQALEDRKNDK